MMLCNAPRRNRTYNLIPKTSKDSAPNPHGASASVREIGTTGGRHVEKWHAMSQPGRRRAQPLG